MFTTCAIDCAHSILSFAQLIIKMRRKRREENRALTTIRKVLITGSNGFIGFHLASFLSGLGIETHCIDNFSNSENDEFYAALLSRENVFGYDLDLELGDLAGIPDDFDLVFHLAAKNGTANFYESPFDVLKSATIPTIRLIEKFKNFSGIFIMASTSENYAGAISKFNYVIPTPEDVPLVIEDIKNPRWSYAAGKIASESAVISAHIQFNMQFIITRIHNVYGPRMGFKHFIPDYILRVLNGKNEVYGQEQTRSFLFVDDACRILFDLARSSGAINEIINVGSKEERTVEEVAILISSFANIDSPLINSPAPVGSVSRRVPDISKLEGLLGKLEPTPIRDGLEKTWVFYSNFYSNLK